jgi:hypothetical protein
MEESLRAAALSLESKREEWKQFVARVLADSGEREGV